MCLTRHCTGNVLLWCQHSLLDVSFEATSLPVRANELSHWAKSRLYCLAFLSRSSSSWYSAVPQWFNCVVSLKKSSMRFNWHRIWALQHEFRYVNSHTNGIRPIQTLMNNNITMTTPSLSRLSRYLSFDVRFKSPAVTWRIESGPKVSVL